MLVGIPLVNLANSRTLVCLLTLLHKVTEHLAPVNLGGNPIHDFLATVRRNGTPSTGRRVCLFNRVLDELLDSLLGNLLCLLRGFAPSIVVIKGVNAVQRVSLASTGLTFAGSSTPTFTLFAITTFGRLVLLHLSQFRQVPFSGLASGQMCERTLSREASHLGKVGKVPVDGKVHRNVVQLPFLWVHIPECREPSTSNVLIDDVVELVLEHILLTGILQSREELWIVNHLQLAFFRNHHTRRWDSVGSLLIHPARQRRKERLVHKETMDVQTKVKGENLRFLDFHSFRFHWLSHNCFPHCPYIIAVQGLPVKGNLPQFLKYTECEVIGASSTKQCR